MRKRLGVAKKLLAPVAGHHVGVELKGDLARARVAVQLSAHGPIDIACLPANGVEVSYPGWEPAVGVPAVMTPDEAVEAARAVQARLLVPIHYDATFEHPEYYRPDRGARKKLEALAEERGVSVEFLAPGDWTEVRAGAEAA